MAWEKGECFFCHIISTLKVSNTFQKNGHVRRSRSVIFIQVKADLEGLTSSTSVLLCLEEDATIEPSHIGGWVESDCFVEGCKGALDFIAA